MMGNKWASLQAVQYSQFSWAESRKGRNVPVCELEVITALTGGYSGVPAWVCITSRPQAPEEQGACILSWPLCLLVQGLSKLCLGLSPLSP